ncbi:MAG TPA: BamA/TamA family outer membrane protein [Flavobacterium sp.]|uniref:translocation and assembly module lipoprotein TamL n=1 Tax=Flavobacterium sp. TaxID=239 RepID=UPI002D0563B3|nr:BamA/TamA family outer membrane protein [Flavobacterium sp.]HSD13089.1 BamA/TamA family outer membrane protein [Flavobacterium sp.]
MKKNSPKIALLFVLGAIIYSCSVVKRVPEGKLLLTDSKISVNDKKTKQETVVDQQYQKPNSSLFGFPLRLRMYNLAKKNADSSYHVWLERKPNRHKNLAAILSEKQVERLGQSFLVSGLSNFLKKNGEAPVIIDDKKAQKTANRLSSYYFNKGYFRTKVNYKIDTLKNKRGQIQYHIETGKPFIIDSITSTVETPILDSLYQKIKHLSFIKTGKQYDSKDLIDERKRISTYFRDNGAYKFQETNISYKVDTIKTGYKTNVELVIDNQTIKEKDSDSLIKIPFRLYKISEVNVFTFSNSEKDKVKVADSITYKDINLYSSDKLAYRPKAITDAIFISKGSLFSDTERTLTSKSLNNLRIFNYPTIEYVEDERDSTGNSLITNIILRPRKKYSWTPAIDFMHSNIQDFGISGNMTFSWRNVFRGAEILDISTRGSIGSSKDMANPKGVFFNISEYGADIKLTIPRILFPIKTERIIPGSMFPTTTATVGFSRQRNIGLDKENFSGIINYNWLPTKTNTARLDLLNIQFVRNLNPQNYFNVYESSYETLNDYAQVYNTNPDNVDENGDLTIEGGGADNFINDVLTGQTTLTPEDEAYQDIRSIDERQNRLTENNLIFATNFTYTKSTKTDLLDNSFNIFRTKIESAGVFLNALSNLGNEKLGPNGKKTFLDVEYSQYIKTEFDFIKHWDLGRKKVYAMRGFFGIAIPYGNADNVPFSRSYYGGGSNDNRAWESYGLGPGTSGGINDFNEANMKLAFSAEYRFNLFGKWNAALFADAGNIWNIWDNVEDKRYTFNGWESLKDVALGTGIGIRYDFNFFIGRLDLGFKTYNPAKPDSERWFKDMRFDKSVVNIGINYPF